MKQGRVDTYVLETLMPDLVLHDHRPSAFLVYLQLSHRAGRRRVQVSHREMAEMTGLSKAPFNRRFGPSVGAACSRCPRIVDGRT